MAVPHGLGSRLALTIIALAAASVACAVAPPAESRPLRWAADAEGGAPYVSKDPKKLEHNVGFEVDLAEALGKELGRKIQFVQYEFKQVVTGLERGDFDFAMNGLEVTPDRLAALRFTRPYYIYTLQLVTRADDQRYKSLADCRKAEALVGTLEDTAAQRLLAKEGMHAKIYPDQTTPYLDLKNGRLDAVLLDTPIALYYAKPDPKLKFVGPPLGKGYYAIGFRKTDGALADQFDAALMRLWDNGTLRRIYEKWDLWNVDQEDLPQASYDSVVAQMGHSLTLSRYLPLLCRGAVVTVELTILSMLLAMAIGLPLAMMRLYGPAPLRWVATVYVEFFRGIPVLLLLFFLYFGLPEIAQQFHLPVELKLWPMAAAILGFGLNYGAYEAEIYRAGISSISIGQWEAGASLGMSRWDVFCRIILPQAIRVIIPPMTNDFVALFKDTSVVSIIAVEELTKDYQMLAKSSLKYLELGLVTALLYLMMSIPLSHLSRYLERRWGKGR
jgi:polar amino acid transport system substrate-binding protein